MIRWISGMFYKVKQTFLSEKTWPMKTILFLIFPFLVFFTPKALNRGPAGMRPFAHRKPQFKAFPLQGSAKNFHLFCTEEGTFSPPQTPPLADCL